MRWLSFPLTLAACGGSVPLVAPAQESSFGCAHGIVSVGDATVTVEQKCGAPLTKEDAAGGGAETTSENWFYGGGNKLAYRFYFRAGKLMEIERLSR